MSSPCISVRGARQHNLKNIDVDIPHHQLVVVTGLSGSGKSSLAFDTLYAEGQRRYVETFSPYTRQFLERMDKPDVDRIEGIPPAIAIEQSNAVKSSRSTVGTMTEIADHLKLLFAHSAALTCSCCGRPVHPQGSSQIADDVLAERSGEEVLISFTVPFTSTPRPRLSSALETLKQQGFLRVWLEDKIVRTDESVPETALAPEALRVIQDRLRVTAESRSRLAEAIDSALRHGQGQVQIFATSGPVQETELRFANNWTCPYDGTVYREPAPSLFSFNNPLGACPTCRGFGRTIELDIERALPDRRLSIKQGVVKPWQSGTSEECQRDLLKHCRTQGIPINVPFCELSPEHQRFVMEGELTPGTSLNELWEAGGWYGVRGFFTWLESKTYKMHVRVFLSRYRAYIPCPTCQGTRFQAETLNFRLNSSFHSKKSLTLPEINRLSLYEAILFFQHLHLPADDEPARQLKDTILTRLNYLREVGLGYLTLDRTTRTLSGGEIQRVNLTSCLGNSLVNTLFVLDEPSIGLHPRDTQQLIDVMKRLRDRGNTVLVVEHEEAVMREADTILELGPGRGAQGGELIFSGPFPDLLKKADSLTGAYLSERKTIPLPAQRRTVRPEFTLQIKGAYANNLQHIDVTIPLGIFVAISGVSGSGKSTLVHQVLHPALLAARQIRSEEGTPPELEALLGAEHIAEVIHVDQTPLSRTPRSNAVLYLGAYEGIRDLFASTEAAKAQGFSAGDFSFNGGQGRCPRCHGSGSEKVEMQFLADVFVTCPVCEGKRFQAPLLQVTYREKNVHEVLETTVDEAILFFDPAAPDLETKARRQHEKIQTALKLLSEVGLGYLRLGQPLNQLSGGEAQRIKLLRYLSGAPEMTVEDDTENENEAPISHEKKPGQTRLFILDEPTTGLHFEDIRLLLGVLQRLVEQGDSLIVIEHNLDVIKCADWVLDLGPEAGTQGGQLVAAGTPEQVAQIAISHTGRYLADKVSTVAPALRLQEKAKIYGAKKTPTRRLELAPDRIRIRGARHHNLKNISVDIPLNEMTVITGLSGSGKSTLAFDLLFAEGQRRYLDSLNAYARQFVEQLEKPEVDSITGIPPAVAIEQRVTRGGRKSTVATITEIFQFIRLLYAKLGQARDPATDEPAIRQTPAEIGTRLLAAAGKQELRILAPLIKGRKGYHTEIAKWAEKKGYPFLRVDGKWVEPAKFKALDRYVEHTISVQLGQFSAKLAAPEQRKLVESALALGRGTFYAHDPRGRETIYSTQLYCPSSGTSFDELEPRLFSFNSPHGWCPACQGFGTQLEVRTDAETEVEREAQAELARELSEIADEALPPCPVCAGQRLNPLARAVRLPFGRGAEKSGGLTIGKIGELSVADALDFFETVKPRGREARIARDILPEIRQRLKFLIEVGLGYLSLNRSAATLSGGESQRIRLAAQLGSDLQGVLYVLDEPTIGLHPRDNARLLESLGTLRGKGNTLVVVEHDEDTMRYADRIIDLGPGAGTQGGEIIAQGPWRTLAKDKNSVTGKILGTPLVHPLRGQRRSLKNIETWCTVRGANAHNLQNIEVTFPVGRFIALCGVSGAGKSTLMHDVIKPAAQGIIAQKGKRGKAPTGPWSGLENFQIFSSIYEVDQTPIGKTSRSTPATYIGLMDEIRGLFARLPLARQRGYEAGRFSFNSGEGRCPACLGQGAIKVEMNFLPATFVPCETCRGQRYTPETLEVRYNEKSINDILNMTIEQAVDFFSEVPRLQRPLALLRDTGLGYLTLGQRSPTLSGGEAQRIKLVSELAKSLEMNTQKRLKTRGFTGLHHLYLLEEPTIGLHLSDVQRLLEVLHQLVDAGHTVMVIEHHLDVLADADYLIELGPEAGQHGGRIIAHGTPEVVAKSKKSVTGPFLAKML